LRKWLAKLEDCYPEWRVETWVFDLRGHEHTYVQDLNK
jgi:hypothetical protein